MAMIFLYYLFPVAYWLLPIACLIFHHRHRGFHTFFLEYIDVFAVNVRWLFIHRDHRPERIAKAVMAVLRTVAAHGKVAHGAATGIEVAVPHEIVWRINRADLKWMELAFFAVLPQHDVTFALRNDDHRAWSVAMKGTAATRRKLRHMTAVSRVGEREAHVLYAFAFHGKIVEGELIDVRHQISFPVTLCHAFIVAQKLVAFVETVAEIKWITKDEILVVKNIDHARASRTGKQAHRVVARSVVVNVRGIQRNREDRALRPFKGDFAGAFLPNRSRAAPLGDINDFLEQMSLRQRLAPRSDFAHIGVGLLLIGKIEIATGGAHALPSAELQGGHIGDNVALDDRNTFFCLQLVVRRRTE